ncbi:MAG TPA: HNH endonuclease [Candidatus Atribacteria bacterium]|nr:HNH endonuclease [Candidatus Atribacteria bacterium]
MGNKKSKGKKKKNKRVPISEEKRAKLLLWCARHCCFCGKACTTNIEFHHIDGDPSNNDEDNLIPLCFDCHGEIDRYNPEHPKGTNYRYLEIKTRREQMYELYTRPYLRQIEIKISKYCHHIQDKTGKPKLRPWGDTSCTVRTLSRDIPIKLRLRIEPYHYDQHLEAGFGGLYTGKILWNLNPSQIVFGHFKLPISEESDPFNFRVEIFWSIIDILEREHQMLPFSYVWNNPESDWWFDPRIIPKHNNNLNKDLI